MRRPIFLFMLTVTLTVYYNQPAAEPAPPERAEETSSRQVIRVVAMTEPLAPTDRAPYVADQIMVAPVGGASLAAIAAEHGAEVVRAPGRSGYGALRPADGVDVAALRAALAGDPRVVGAAPMGRVLGAASGNASARGTERSQRGGAGAEQVVWDSGMDTGARGGADSGEEVPDPCLVDWGRGRTPRAMDAQWHLDMVTAPAAGAEDLSGIVVAVLDSGVAYEDHEQFAQAPSLGRTRFVSPWDFVNGDEHANDDHMHGTHMTSIITSWGEVEGVAPGVSVMPVKVLAADNSGTELDLVEGIHHAVDNGADIINMSLAFPYGYFPSAALREAIEDAYAAGVLMVAATGNDGADFVAFPAAHPLVLSIGAQILQDPDDQYPAPAGYSNRSAAADLLAPGGDIDRDDNGDRYPDGVLAESILPEDPSQTALWFYAGTSQATPVASGVAAHLLHAGVEPELVRGVMQYGAYEHQDGQAFFQRGVGAGWLRVDKSLQAACAFMDRIHDPDHYQAALLAWPAATGSDEVTPSARVTVLDVDGAPAEDKLVLMTLWGQGGGMLSCTTDAWGQCDVQGPALSPSEDPLAGAWAFNVEAVVDQGVSYHPRPMVFTSDALEILLAALAADERTAGAPLAIHWDGGDDAALGEVAAGYTIFNGGAGLSSSPLAVVMLPGALPEGSSQESVSVDLDGVGLASIPLSFAELGILTLDGTGLSSSPLAFQDLTLVTFEGSGLSSSPLALTGDALLGDGGGALDDDGLDLDGGAVLLGSSESLGVSLDGTSTGAWLDAGGWSAGDYPSASLLLGSGASGIAPASYEMTTSGYGVVAY